MALQGQLGEKNNTIALGLDFDNVIILLLFCVTHSLKKVPELFLGIKRSL